MVSSIGDKFYYMFENRMDNCINKFYSCVIQNGKLKYIYRNGQLAF